MYFDSHTHLDDGRLRKDIDRILGNAQENGVSLMLNPGADLETSMNAVEIASNHKNVYAAVGVHPHDAKAIDEETFLLIRSLARKPKVVAIGEIGLDFYYDHSPRDVQEYWFRRQIQLAKELNLPVIIHDRDAHDRVMTILKEEGAFETGVVMHCFSGSAELARQYVKLGAMISIAGPVTYKNARKTVEVVEEIALDHLFIETDSPYLSPEPLRGKTNEPANVRFVAEKIAQIKGISIEDVALATAENAKRFFKIR